MPTTTTPAQDHQERWQEIVDEPLLSELPYKVETNARGQIVLSPHKNRHSVVQEQIQGVLSDYAPDGLQPTEFAIATPEGVKVADVIWMSPSHWKQMQETGDPSTLAPELCVEVMSESKDWEEMREKIGLYLEAGAEEVWVVDSEQHVRFFGEEELEHSEIARGRGTSLSALVEDYFRLLSRKDSPDVHAEGPALTPRLKRVHEQIGPPPEDAPFDEPRGNLSDDEQQFVKAATDKQA